MSDTLIWVTRTFSPTNYSTSCFSLNFPLFFYFSIASYVSISLSLSILQVVKVISALLLPLCVTMPGN